jgi:hypothetical protein
MYMSSWSIENLSIHPNLIFAGIRVVYSLATTATSSFLLSSSATEDINILGFVLVVSRDFEPSGYVA